ncbi:hypothetical protein EG68_06729 [Paragonimus skrjabini miyazakii]|uniref:Beclin 1-associated autophagy-related key regulator n=1 Tax=Paragonimus skrjabini miyazakii TaxID=59628 RepID=A0A8S9YP85_9TREM|nr:hypothetical protein EG68_06729 [Paragonimus skrjabini miyazakii]
MNVKDSNTNTSEEEYQIIDASCFSIEAQDQGLEFHLNLPCPVCGSFQSNFICEKCINSGSFVHSRRPTSHKIKLLTETLLARLPPKSNGPVEELKALIASLEKAHAYNVEQNRKKRERRDQIRKRMIHCHTKSQQLSKNRCFLTKHYSSITQKRTILEKDFAKHSLHIERLRARYFKELLQSHFVAKLSPDEDSVDQFSGAKLYLDKENVFVGPEPRLSSHTALTYSVPTIRAAIVFTDLWLPPIISQHLRLSGSFLASLPQRDNLGRVYSALLHAVHMLCANRGLHARTVMELLGKPLPTNHSEFDPIVGLDFDAPFFYALDGFFGDVPPPIWDSQNIPKVVRLHLEHVELGEEVKEVDDQSSADGDESSTSDWSTSLQVVSTSLTNPVTSSDPDKLSMTSNELDRWELITPQQDQVMEEKTTESKASPCQSLKASHDTTTGY